NSSANACFSVVIPRGARDIETMSLPNWQNLAVDDGILREPVAEKGRIVLWLPGASNSNFREWRRLANVPRAGIVLEQGIASTPATVVCVRQQVQGFIGGLFQRFRRTSDDATWSLPNGEVAQQYGQRRTDVFLAWAEGNTRPLDEEHLWARWPDAKEI